MVSDFGFVFIEWKYNSNSLIDGNFINLILKKA